VKVVASEFGSNFVPLGIGKSVVVDVPRDIKDVLVADPKIANAVVRTSRRAYLIGAAIGQTSVFFFDAEGRQLAGFDIAVTRDLNGMRAALKQMFPEGNVHVEGIAEGVMLSGAVATPVEAQQAYDVAKGLVGETGRVVNGGRPMWCMRWRRRNWRARTTATPTLRIPRPSCSAASTGSTADPVPSTRRAPTAAPTAS
jgi:pilus assembly protein CpaC